MTIKLLEREKSDNKLDYDIVCDELKVGRIEAFELNHETPYFELEVLEPYRNQGIGKEAITKLLDHIFNEYEQVHKIMGYTDIYNVPMKRLFIKCGFLQELSNEKSLDDIDPNLQSALGYCIVKEDFLNN